MPVGIRLRLAKGAVIDTGYLWTPRLCSRCSLALSVGHFGVKSAHGAVWLWPLPYSLVFLIHEVVPEISVTTYRYGEDYLELTAV